jgi:hypothetical protein
VIKTIKLKNSRFALLGVLLSLLGVPTIRFTFQLGPLSEHTCHEHTGLQGMPLLPVKCLSEHVQCVRYIAQSVPEPSKHNEW